ncbi:metallophosphoesterase [Sediminibacillus massiliensis]|uniref:metallophosphoesterase n=1 Tax=Sediminibacillus massiliensis TaxID=1926277 RepID=UPI00098831FB|nr:metallophosphoesterase [Sediminibacillus massiliensis]
MPSVLIMSDSHGLEAEVQEIKQRHRGEVDQFIHCGDSELDADSVELSDFMKVAGNCDFDSRLPEEQKFSVGDMEFLVVHGHLHQVKTSLMPLSYRAEELGAQIVCFGHTHYAGAERVENKLFLNPGSIRLPRGRKEKTYAILKWTTKSEIDVEFYTVDGVKIDNMSFRTSLK